MKELVVGFMEREWTKEEKILCMATAGLLGMMIGFLFSPIKSGINAFSHNGSHNSNNKAYSKNTKSARK